MRFAGRRVRNAVCGGATLFFCLTLIQLLLAPVGKSQATEDAAFLHVAVHDSNGQPVADATVSIQTQTADADKTLTARTDAQGSCSFSNLHAGVYVVRAERAGYIASTLPSLSLAAKEVRAFEVTLVMQKIAAPGATAEFFDTPHFTVSGVTDTTSIGGHGSDAVARTRESLAKDTVSLSEPTSMPAAVGSADEAALRLKVGRDPANFSANLDLGRILLAEGKSREALQFLDRAAQAVHDESSHDRGEVHRLLGRAQEQLGNSLDAVREYQHAAELDPSEANLFEWGSELLLHHAPEPALEVFGKGNQLFPQSARMLMGLGAAWFAGGSFDRAVERVCQASDLNPADSAPYRFLATMQGTQTIASDELVARLRRFAALQPENAAANYYLAVGLWKQHKNLEDTALLANVDSLLRTALRLEPDFGAAYLQLGIFHADQKDFSQAISDYQRALRADSSILDSKGSDFKMTKLEIAETHYRMAQAYREIGKNDTAKAELQLYQQISKESAEQAARQRREIGQFVYSLRDQDSVPYRKP